MNLRTILIRGARQVLTLRGGNTPRRGPALNELNPIADGAVLIRDGKIIEVGPTRRLENLAQARCAFEIECAGRVVIPGLIDCHTHLAMPHSGGEDDAARLVRSSTGQRLEARARAIVESMARHGTTTVEVKTGCGPDESAETKLLRVFCALSGAPLDLVPSFLCRLPHEDPISAAEWVTAELLPKIHRRKAAQFADIACNGDDRLVTLYDRYLHSARALGFPCKIHAGNLQPADAIRLAIEHRVATIDHLEHASQEDARRIGQAGMLATLLPIASFHDCGAEPPARTLIDSGAAVAIATNFTPHHFPTLNMQTAIELACLRLQMTIEEAISAATINAAHAVGRASRIGSIEPGKAADIVILSVSDYHDLRNSLGTNVVHQTIKNGEVIYREGDVTYGQPVQMQEW